MALKTRLKYESEQGAPGKRIAGVDEVGRGCLVGPVVVCAAVLPESAYRNPPKWLKRVDDSKRLAPAVRLELSHVLKEYLLAYSIIWISAKRIDEINIHQATLEGMKQAFETLTPSADFGLFDGKWVPPTLAANGIPIIQGDHHSLSIAAASILAKVARDQWMVDYSKLYPGYSFEINKGYPTPEHRDGIKSLGVTPEHRRSFAPVTEVVAQDLQLQLF